MNEDCEALSCSAKCTLVPAKIDKPTILHGEKTRKELQGNSSKKPVLFPQLLATVTCAVSHFGIGFVVAFSGVTLPQFTDTNTTDIFLDEANAAFFSSSSNFGAAFGSLMVGPLMVTFEQRTTLLLVLPVCLFAWGAMVLTNAILVLQGARVVLGMCVGIIAMAAPMYVVEFAHVSYRGFLDGVVTFCRNAGILAVFALGSTSLSWRHLALVCGLTTTVPPFLGLLLLPRSPRWLGMKRRHEEAAKSLRFFRGPEYDISTELADIKAAADSCGVEATVRSQLLQLRDPSLLRLFLIMTLLIFLASWSGYMTVVAYAVSIFEDTGTGINPYMCAVILSALRVLGAMTYMLLVDRLSRRKAFLASFVLCSLSLVGLGAYFYIQIETDNAEVVFSIRLLPLLTMLVLIFFSCIAIPIALLLFCEILPLSFRSLGCSMLDFFFFFSSFIVSQSFPFMNDALRPYGTFWIYAGITFCVSFVPLLFLPETRGKTLEEIEATYRKRKVPEGVEEDACIRHEERTGDSLGPMEL